MPDANDQQSPGTGPSKDSDVTSPNGQQSPITPSSTAESTDPNLFSFDNRKWTPDAKPMEDLPR